MTLGVGSSVAAIALLSLPSLAGLISQICRRQPARDSAIYSDADGQASPDTVKAFSTKLPKTVLLLSSLLGLGASLAATVLTTRQFGRQSFFLENWLLAGSWVS